MEEETQTNPGRFKSFQEVYGHDEDLEIGFEEDYDLPVLDFCEI